MIFFLPTPRLLIDKLNTHRNIGGFSPLPLLVRFYKKNVFLYKNDLIRCYHARDREIKNIAVITADKGCVLSHAMTFNRSGLEFNSFRS